MKKLFFLLIAVLCMSVCASAQTRTVTGTVVDATNDEPLYGASVVPVGTTKGVLTDIDGNFSITINASVKQLTFSYVGYQTVNVPVKDKMTVSLTPSSETLEAVVVTGYGSGKKLGSITGSVAQIGSAALANITTPSFVDALQGKVAGLSVLSSSGDPSSTENDIRIRGVNSINSSNTPLFILDGAPVTQSVFSTLNPNDIESITVLKDAASVAIYGTRAANGVIVITSKKGKTGEKAHIDFRFKYGWSQMTQDRVDMMSSEQYIKYRDLINAPVSQDMRDAWEKYGINTDWRKEIFNSSAPTYSLEAAISGGSEHSNYYLSLNHMDQQGIIDQSAMRRETIRVNLSSEVTDWLRVGAQFNLGYTKYQQNNESNAIYSGSGVYVTNPMVFSRKALPLDATRYYTIDDNGQIVWGERAQYLHYTQAPTPWYINENRSVWRNRATINGNIYEQITPIEGLTIRAQQAIDAYDLRLDNIGYAHYTIETPMGDIYGDTDIPGDVNDGYNQQSFSRYYQFTYTNTAEYRKRFADVHNMTILVGQEAIIGKSSGFGVFTEGQSDRRLYLLSQGTSVQISDISYSEGETAMNSYFLSGSYNYADKYFFDANLRRDGSSYFAPDHRWGTFWSLGAMWDLKQENFLKSNTKIDTARFRVSYGTTGNSNFANYAYFGLISAAKVPYNGQTPLVISQAPNYDLTWERVNGLDVGFNVGLFNKINLDFDFYNKLTTDMILEVPFSYTTGVSGNYGNVSEMRNTGIDVQLTVTPVQTKDWFWELRGNFNYNHNEITKLFDGLDELIYPESNIIYTVGKPAGQYYMVRYAGVDPRDGRQQWYTKEGNLTKVYNFERDAVCIDGKQMYSPLGGGFGTTLAWKGLSLRADFIWAAGKSMINNDLYFCQNNNFAQTYNQTTKMLDVWTHEGQVTDIPAPGQALEFDTRWLENANFMRLKTLTLQYKLANNLCKKIGVSGLGAHFTGRNLLTFTNYTGYDPEPESNVVAFFYPNTRQYEFGIDVSF